MKLASSFARVVGLSMIGLSLSVSFAAHADSYPAHADSDVIRLKVSLPVRICRGHSAWGSCRIYQTDSMPVVVSMTPVISRHGDESQGAAEVSSAFEGGRSNAKIEVFRQGYQVTVTVRLNGSTHDELRTGGASTAGTVGELPPLSLSLEPVQWPGRARAEFGIVITE